LNWIGAVLQTKHVVYWNPSEDYAVMDSWDAANEHYSHWATIPKRPEK
jgi:hypothetical protein